MAIDVPQRWAGPTAMLGGVSWTVMLALTAAKPEHPQRGPGGLIALVFAALLCFAAGAVGIHARQRRRAGRLGTATVVLAAGGVAATVLGRAAVDAGVAPPAAFAAGLAVLLVSFLLFAVATIAAGVLPRAAGALLLLGTLLLAAFNFGDALIWLGAPFGLAWLWLGYALWSGRGVTPPAASR